ncbi:MAG: hypothetical protein O2857_28885, partial [Planctomycetota bacterium]|nr:hypothetical protein [Planctomycetota bacterium]
HGNSCEKSLDGFRYPWMGVQLMTGEMFLGVRVIFAGKGVPRPMIGQSLRFLPDRKLAVI